MDDAGVVSGSFAGDVVCDGVFGEIRVFVVSFDNDG